MRASSTVLSALIALALLASGAAAQTGSSQQITGMIGDPTVDPDAVFPDAWLRYTGDPAPAGYSHDYQWATPRIVTESPEERPISMTGTLDLSDRQERSTAVLGFYDRQALASGDNGYQTGAYVYVSTRADGVVIVGPTDGNAGGGELVQRFISTDDLPDELGITFTVDGTADPAGCANDPDDLATAVGCLVLEIGGFGTLTDSYGTILAPGSADPEFSTGAIPGWDSFTDDGEYGPTGIRYDVIVSPVTLQTADQCRRGGWRDYGFSNQGQCIRFVQTGQDSRT